MFKKIFNLLRFYGFVGVWQLIKLKIPYITRIKGYREYLNLLAGKKGLEIGGPTFYFRSRGPLPVYSVVGALDGVNFSQTTVWEGKLAAGKNYKYEDDKVPGEQFISEAADLKGIPAGKYDFILSSHCLEHVADPIKALREWIRVIKPGGYVLLVLPLREKTFDHRRPPTTLAHLISDHEQAVTENDQTHLAEILAWHDLSLDPKVKDREAFKLRCLNNQENRCLHHHVFNEANLKELIQYVGLKLPSIKLLPPRDLIILARKG